MNIFRTLLITLLGFGLMSCQQKGEDLGGDNITQQFLNQYSGSYVEKSENSARAERMVISNTGLIEVTRIRQVGTEGNPAIPYPTNCSYILKGRIRNVIQLRDQARVRVNAQGGAYFIPATHNLTFSVSSVELTDSLESATSSTNGCHVFESNMKQNPPTYTYGMELFGGGVLRLHTKGTEEYSGGPATFDILDEVYQRL